MDYLAKKSLFWIILDADNKDGHKRLIESFWKDIWIWALSAVFLRLSVVKTSYHQKVNLKKSIWAC